MSLRASIILVVALASASEASAQWSAPSYLPPRPGEDIGVYLAYADGLAVQAVWRQHGNLNLGVRVGYMDSYGGVVAAAETWGPLFGAGGTFPLDVSWTLGAGAVFGDGSTSAEIPAGISIGRTISFHPFVLQLYGHPRLSLILRDGLENEEETELGGLFDLGLDVTTDRGLTLRLGTTFGTFNALGVGLALKWGRAVEIR